MGKKVFMLLLLLSSSTTFAASEVSSSVEHSEVSVTSESGVEVEDKGTAASSGVLSEEAVLEKSKESVVISVHNTENQEDVGENVSLESVEKSAVKNDHLVASSRVVKNTAESETTKVFKDYKGIKGQTLKQVFSDGEKTSAYLTDSSGTRIKSWSYYDNGKVKASYTWNGTQKLSRVEYNSNGQKKQLTTYYSNGKVKELVKFNNQVRTETVRYGSNGKRSEHYTYYSNNQVKRKVTYKSGRRNQTIDYTSKGLRTKYYTYHNDGSVNRKVVYNSNGKRSETIDYTSKGLRTKRYRYYSDGKVEYKDFYKQGKLNLTYEYNYKTGKIVGKGTYYSNGKQKIWKDYNSNGKVIYYATYNSKGEIKNHKNYSNNGILEDQMFYKNGKYSKYEKYYSNGQKSQFVDFGPSAIRKSYDKKGNVTKTETPVDDSYCKKLGDGPECMKIKEFTKWGSVRKTYYAYSMLW